MFGRKKKSSVIKVEVASDLKIEEGKLVEIKDEMILARLNQAVPEIARAMNAGAKTVAAVQGPAYRCVLPAGATKVATGAVKGAQAGSLLATASLTFSVAALIVGQKFMADISKRLAKLDGDLRAVSDFQNNEYKSRVEALILRVTSVISYRSEVTKNDAVRQRALMSLDNAESECMQLLGQATETINSFTQTRVSDFDRYCTAVKEIAKWLDYQNKLVAVLYHISELKYALNFGAVSRDYCASSFRVCLANVAKSQKLLKKWHTDEINKLDIDTSALKRRRMGADAALHFLPGLFKKECKYRKLSEDTAHMIETQRTCDLTDYKPLGRSFDDDVEIFVKDGKVYYLESASEE